MDYIEQITNPFCKNLVLKTLNHPKVKDKFFLCPGAIGHHHVYAGGLVAHTLEVIMYGLPMIEYNCLDRNFYLTMAIIHDVGKVFDYKWDNGVIETTSAMVYKSHIISGPDLLISIMARMDNVDEKDSDTILNGVRSHHGKPEWGSPIPNITEAYILFVCDDASAKVSVRVEETNITRLAGKEFTEYNKDAGVRFIVHKRFD